MEAKNQLEIEKIMKKVYYDYDNAVSYKVWVKNFALNLQHIWNEESLKKFGERYTDLNKVKQKEIRKMYPQKISEAEPKNIGENL